MSSKFFSAIQSNSSLALVGSAKHSAISPGLLGAISYFTCILFAFSKAFTISKTEYPFPVPKLYGIAPFTLHALFKAYTCPLAKSTTCI